VDLQFSEEQEMLRATLRDMLEHHSSPEIVRELEDTPEGFSTQLWQELARGDLIGLTLPEQFGGSGMGALESVVLYEEFGRALASTPHLHTAVLGAGLLLAAGTPQQQEQWLPMIARGEVILTTAWYESQRSEGPAGIQVTAKRDGDGYRLSGTKIRVPLASSAGAIAVLARTGDAPTDISIFYVAPDADGVSLEQTAVLGSDAEYEVVFNDVELTAAHLLGEQPNIGWTAFTTAMDDVLLTVAAFAVGGAARALEMTVEYAKTREQFGQPIGSFQGLAHPVADMATEVTGAQVLVYQAAWRRANGLPLGPLASMAKVYACDVFKRTTKVGQQVFGGVGFTRALDIQLYFRRAKQLELTWGGPAFHDEVIAAAELDRERGWVSIDAGVE
jgi:alkylation response protein AidB-like acyl-CoA dehydrogenase